MEATGRAWIKFRAGSCTASCIRDWDGLQEHPTPPLRAATVWAPPALSNQRAYAEWDVTMMRGRSMVMLGVLALRHDRRSHFWGDFPSGGGAVYLCYDKYGYAAIKDGGTAVSQLPNGIVSFEPGVLLRVELDSQSESVVFSRGGKEVARTKAPASTDGNQLVFAAQLLGSSDQVCACTRAFVCDCPFRSCSMAVSFSLCVRGCLQCMCRCLQCMRVCLPCVCGYLRCMRGYLPC